MLSTDAIRPLQGVHWQGTLTTMPNCSHLSQDLAVALFMRFSMGRSFSGASSPLPSNQVLQTSLRLEHDAKLTIADSSRSRIQQPAGCC